MVNEKEMEGIVLRAKETRLSISRVPKKTKKEFVEFANEEFEEDYGMCLKYVWDNFKLWKLFFENMNMKLDNILTLVSKPKQETEGITEDIIMLSGKIVKKGGKNTK